MPAQDWAAVGPDEVLGFWFPADGHEVSYEAHHAYWMWRMRGGADDAIRERFSKLAEAAATGLLDHWADTPRGRLALIVALDQFSRSVWRDTPGAFAQDIAAARLALEGLENGHYTALPNVWERTFYVVAIVHCEGPGHLARVDRCLGLCAELLGAAPEQLRTNYRVVLDQNRLAREVIARFGRYPHRNAVLGRISRPAEAEYVATGEFPHQRKIPDTAREAEGMLAAREQTP